MKPLNYAILFVLAIAGLAACQKKNSGVEELENLGEGKFFATIEQETDSGANVNEGLCVSWDANDRVSIFNRSTRNDEYRFTGETGDNSGWFELVQHKGSSEGNKSDYTYAVYPYLETTGITDSGILTVALPAQQYFREGSFGSGTNVMVARVDDNLIQFRNALGYLVLKIYGSGIQVSSVTLKGNDGEVLAGNAKITISPKGVPSTKMLADGGKTLTLVCETPVVPGATPEDAAEFWFALPPATFGKGYTVEITDADGNTFTEVTKETVEVARNQMVSTDPVWLLGDGNNFVSVDKKPAFTLTSVTGGDTAGGYQKWEFYSDKEVRVQIISWPCNCSTQDHIGYHLTLAELDIPGITLISIPLMRAEGDEYTSTNKSVAGVHLNEFQIVEDGTHLDFDLSVTLKRETDGNIRIVYSGPVTPALQDPEEAALLPGVFTVGDKQYRFSKGNLQAVLNNGVITKWQFAENQWDVVGDLKKLTNETGIVDQFVYSTTAPLNRWGIHPLFLEFLPVSWWTDPNWEEWAEQHFDEYRDYYMTNYQIGSYRPQWTNPDLIAEYGDGWTLPNLFSFVMTFDHEEYLTHGTKYYYYNARFTPARVTGISSGFVLFPDNYVQPEGIPLERIEQIVYRSNIGNYITSPNFTSEQVNVYTAEQWVEMEAAGAVFLPMGTYRSPRSDSFYDDQFFSNTESLGASQFIIGGLLFEDHAGPECPDLIRLVKPVE